VPSEQGTRQAGRWAGGVPAKLGSVLIANAKTQLREEDGGTVETGCAPRTHAKTPNGKRVGVPAKLGGVFARDCVTS